jgi:hypothetical protein
MRIYTPTGFSRLTAALCATLLIVSVNSIAQNKKPALTPVNALMSNQAADAVGVNTHLNYGRTLYNSRYEDIIKPRLIELGTKHIRDHFGNESVNARYVELAHNYGIKLLLINSEGGKDLTQVKDEVIRLNKLNPAKPVVDLIEPANERDNGWKSDWARLCTYLTDYYKVFKGDPGTASIPLLGPSFANTRDAAVNLGKACATVPGTMEIGNLHAYSGLYPESPLAGGWGISFDKAIANYRTISLDKPMMESESGYKMGEGMGGHPAVSQRAAAKYSPRLVLTRLSKGVSKLYFYQLINADEDFGMLNDDGSPREQFTSLKNFIHLMADEGKDFAPKPLKYALNGDTKDINQMLFQKRDGKYMLVIWQGVNGSAKGTKKNDYTDVENPDRQLELQLDKKAASVKIYRPSFNKMPDGNGTEPIATIKNKAVVNLSVPDHILIVEISFKK